MFKPRRDEVFIDAGCYNGDTIANFIKWTGGSYSYIYGIEPNKESAYLCRNNICKAGYQNVEIIEAAAYSKNGCISFHCDDGELKGTQSAINPNGELTVKTRTIDDILAGERVSLIKMDLEGGEKAALIGACKTIKKWHPKLAISIYHKKEDIFELPSLILNYCNEYRFRIRHYSNFSSETVLYAYVENSCLI